MSKSKIRTFVLNHFLSREMFFFFGGRKANLKKIDKNIRNLKKDNRPVTMDLIVSLTSYGKRLSELKYTLYSLISQSIKPEKIVVNVAENDRENLTSELLFFSDFGIEFNFCEDLRSYKKLVPVLQKYPDKVIVTCDDDLYFSKNWLEKLWCEHLKHPGDVVCHLAYKITHDGSTLNTYQKWIHNAKIKNYDNAIFLLGGAGCLYPQNSLFSDVGNKGIFTSVCSFADDMWFYFMALLNKTKIRQVENKPEMNLRYINPYREYGIEDGDTLTNINVNEGQNDRQFKAILTHYNISEERFIQYLNGNIDYLLE